MQKEKLDLGVYDVLEGVTSKNIFWGQAPRPPLFITVAIDRLMID